MKVVLYQTWDELQPLAGIWNEVLADSSGNTIFLTWEWCQAWWSNYGASRRLFVLGAWQGNELAGIAPLYVDRSRRWGATWNCLRVIGDGSHDSDYLDCFARRGWEAQAIPAFMEFLDAADRDWDWLEINGVPQNSSSLAAMLDCVAERKWRSDREPVPCATLVLPKQWDEYLKSLQPRFRTTVRSSLSRIEQQPGFGFRECGVADDLNAWMGDLFSLHTRRWGRSHKPGVFRNPAKRRFYHDISRAALRRGWLAFHRLDWGEHPLALQYGFRYANRFYLLQEGYDPDFESLRPGTALRAWLMRHWIEQGLEEYDFLAGTALHKRDWGAQEKFSFRLLIARKRTGAWTSMNAPRWYGKAKEAAAKTIPGPLLSWRRDLLAWRERRRWNSPQPLMSLSRRWLRWTLSSLYSRTPAGAIARSMANHYACNPSTARWFQRRPLPICHIFMYHRVNDDGDPFIYSRPVARFRAEMEYLSRRFQIVSLDQIADGSYAANGRQSCVAVTFDDGYRDNFLYAFPILKQLGIPATIFLTTGYVETGEMPWYDQVRLAFKLSHRSAVSLRDLGGPNLELGSEAARIQASAQVLAWLRAMDEAGRLRSLAELFRQLGVPAQLNLPGTMLSWDDVRQMNKQGIAFGAHTVRHPVLAVLSGDRLRQEIFDSKRAIEGRLQLPVRHFAYPFGKPSDYGSEAKQVVQAAGFETAVTTVSGVNGPDQDLFELKRFVIREHDLGLFGLKFDWYRMLQPQPTSVQYQPAKVPSVSKEELTV